MVAHVNDYGMITRAFGAVPIDVPCSDYGRSLRAVDRSLERLTRVVVDHRHRRTNDGLSLILQASSQLEPKLTDRDIARELHHMVLAGFIVFVEFAGLVIELGRRPRVRRRLLNEVLTHAPSGPVSLEQMARMPYLHQVCLETKRLTPVVPFAIGMAKRDFEFSGYRIPQGYMLGHILYAAMQDPDVFDNPSKFDSDRFADETDEHKLPNLVPQGAGEFYGRGHLCAGLDFSTQLMRIFALYLVRDYEWVFSKQDLSFDTTQLPPVPTDGLVTQLRRREPC